MDKSVNSMNSYKLSKLVIKPTLACNCNCKTCTSRRELHKNLSSQKKLNIIDWKQFFDEVNELDVKTLDISGGEPTLYKNLPELIRYGREKGWKINLNTNGSIIDTEYAEKLLKSGLNSATISLYSPKPEIHDAIKCHNGLWKKATNSVKIFSKFEKKYHNFKINTQTYISRDNYIDFPELIELHYALGSNNIALSYLEGDFENKNLLNNSEIEYFRENIIPMALKSCDKLDLYARELAKSAIMNLFSNNILSDENWANGIYNPGWNSETFCQRPEYFTIILANGDVHPCNIVEYTHYPVMGNLFEENITNIWNSEKWNTFRENLFEMCQYCPINLYSMIPLRVSINDTSLVNKLKKIYAYISPKILK